MTDEIAALAPWFHNLHLPDATRTAPDHFLGDFPTFKREQIRPSGARVTGIDYDERPLAR